MLCQFMIIKFDILSRIDLSILSVNFSYVSFIYAEIFEKMSSGGLEVSFSIFYFLRREISFLQVHNVLL